MKVFAVPRIAELHGFVLGLNVIKTGAACILLGLFVKDNEGVFFLHLAIFYGFVDVLAEQFGRVGLGKGILPKGGFVGGKREQVLVVGGL